MTSPPVLLDPTSERSPVARALSARPPGLHGLSVAALALRVDDAAAAERHATRLLAKPFSRDKLLAALRPLGA